MHVCVYVHAHTCMHAGDLLSVNTSGVWVRRLAVICPIAGVLGLSLKNIAGIIERGLATPPEEQWALVLKHEERCAKRGNRGPQQQPGSSALTPSQHRLPGAHRFVNALQVGTSAEGQDPPLE